MTAELSLKNRWTEEKVSQKNPEVRVTRGYKYEATLIFWQFDTRGNKRRNREKCTEMKFKKKKKVSQFWYHE